MTTSTKRAASPKKGGGSRSSKAAKTEKKDEAKTVEFRGAKLTLPNVLDVAPAMRLAAIQRQGEDVDFMQLFGLLQDLLGSEDYAAATDKVATADSQEDAFRELAEVVFEGFGMSLGESSASSGSSKNTGT